MLNRLIILWFMIKRFSASIGKPNMHTPSLLLRNWGWFGWMKWLTEVNTFLIVVSVFTSMHLEIDSDKHVAASLAFQVLVGKLQGWCEVASYFIFLSFKKFIKYIYFLSVVIWGSIPTRGYIRIKNGHSIKNWV